ncbi:tannase-domain-containing protein [Acephala macrosclerotiorum]|nr:tannase-domain-containing protein [Acephala macrosclerotiorum]
MDGVKFNTSDFDGVITGAPAFRFSFQQMQHLYSNIVQQTLGYYPPAYELQKILNETLAFCDPLDGLTDGVVAPTPEYLSFPLASAWPEQNGTVTTEAVDVTNTIIDDLKDTDEKRVYFSYQPSSTFVDSYTSHNTTSDEWGLSINSFGSEFVTRYLQLFNTSTLPDLDGVTASTEALGDWYRLYLVPGAQHCEPNAYELNGPSPQTNLGVLIDWGENGVTPATANATHLAGDKVRENAQTRAWPLRPPWAGNGTMDCAYDQVLIDTWIHDFDSSKLPVY